MHCVPDEEKNQHVIRLKLNRSLYNGDWVFLGEKRSGKFDHAVPFDFDFAHTVLRTKDDNPIERRDNQTDTTRIGSYTRTFRPLSGSDLENRLGRLRDWIRDFNPTIDILS